MFKLMQISLKYKEIVIVLTLILVVAGANIILRLPLDAFPDTTPVMVHVNSVASELSPVEIEEQILRPLERALMTTSGLTEIRTLGRFGFGQVILIFHDSVSLMDARQAVMEKLAGLELEEGIAPPQIGPPATGMGEVFHYTLKSETLNLKDLLDLQQYVLEPELASVPGVAEVNAWGGKLRRIEILVDLLKIEEYQITLSEIFTAIRDHAGASGGGGIEFSGEYHLVQGDTRYRKIEDIENTVIRSHQGLPVLLKDIANVVDGHNLRRGAVSQNGKGEVLLGLVFMGFGENGRSVSMATKKRLLETKELLPASVETEIIYSRQDIVDSVLETAGKNLIWGALLVVLILFLFLKDIRAGLIVAFSIPFSLLFAVCGMWAFAIPGTLMSLGAIDFGLVVDSSVILVENVSRRLQKAKTYYEKSKIVLSACLEMRQATLFGEIILIVAYLPIVFLSGSEGKLFRPMAYVVMLALAGSFVWSVFVVPVLCAIFLQKNQIKHKPFLMRCMEMIFVRMLSSVLRFRGVVLGFVALLGLAACYLASGLGARFLPKLEEHSIVLATVRLPGIALNEALHQAEDLEKFLLERFPKEILSVTTRIGTAELATDPMGLEQADVFLKLFPPEKWERVQNQTQLQNLISIELQSFLGTKFVITQPIEMRMNEMEAGIRSDLGIMIYGNDLDQLARRAEEVASSVALLPGAKDVTPEKITGGPYVIVRGIPEKMGRYGFTGKDILNLVESIGGYQVGKMFVDEKRYPIAVRFANKDRNDPEKLSDLILVNSNGVRVRLSQIASISMEAGPVLITREKARRRVVVQVNIAHQDLVGFVEDTKKHLDQNYVWNQEIHYKLGGQYQHYLSARVSVLISILFVLVLIFFLLQLSTERISDSTAIMTGAPFAAIGGVFALYWFEIPFSVSAGIGFVIVCGVSMLNGLVLVSTVNQRRKKNLRASIILASRERLRPVLMTAMVAFFGFIPMVFSTGIGAEIQRPLALVVVGGVFSDTLLTLFVLPCLLLLRKTIGPHPTITKP